MSYFETPTQPPGRTTTRRRWYSSRVVLGVGAGLVGLMVGAVGCSAQSTQGSVPAATVTATVTQPAVPGPTVTATATATATVTKKPKPAPTVTVTEPGPTTTETTVVERTVEAEPEPEDGYEEEDAFDYEDDSETQNFSGSVTPDGWDCPDDAPIKGNASSMIYHTPSGAFYDKTNPEECFASESDARAAGYRASKR